VDAVEGEGEVAVGAVELHEGGGPGEGVDRGKGTGGFVVELSRKAKRLGRGIRSTLYIYIPFPPDLL
jgi:hypothetical protein